jgi:hypothetical protein
MSAVAAALFAIPTAYFTGDVNPVRLLACWCVYFVGFSISEGVAQAYYLRRRAAALKSIWRSEGQTPGH